MKIRAKNSLETQHFFAIYFCIFTRSIFCHEMGNLLYNKRRCEQSDQKTWWHHFSSDDVAPQKRLWTFFYRIYPKENIVFTAWPPWENHHCESYERGWPLACLEDLKPNQASHQGARWTSSVSMLNVLPVLGLIIETSAVWPWYRRSFQNICRGLAVDNYSRAYFPWSFTCPADFAYGKHRWDIESFAFDAWWSMIW
jgi:hypothetical protein